jgi:hypothetical protein
LSPPATPPAADVELGEGVLVVGAVLLGVLVVGAVLLGEAVVDGALLGVVLLGAPVVDGLLLGDGTLVRGAVGVPVLAGAPGPDGS